MIPINETETKTFVHGNVVVTNKTMSARQVRVTINGREYTGEVEPRAANLLRDDLGLTGTQWVASTAFVGLARSYSMASRCALLALRRASARR